MVNNFFKVLNGVISKYLSYVILTLSYIQITFLTIAIIFKTPTLIYVVICGLLINILHISFIDNAPESYRNNALIFLKLNTIVLGIGLLHNIFVLS